MLQNARTMDEEGFKDALLINLQRNIYTSKVWNNILWKLTDSWTKIKHDFKFVLFYHQLKYMK